MPNVLQKSIRSWLRRILKSIQVFERRLGKKSNWFKKNSLGRGVPGKELYFYIARIHDYKRNGKLISNLPCSGFNWEFDYCNEFSWLSYKIIHLVKRNRNKKILKFLVYIKTKERFAERATSYHWKEIKRINDKKIILWLKGQTNWRTDVTATKRRLSTW